MPSSCAVCAVCISFVLGMASCTEGPPPPVTVADSAGVTLTLSRDTDLPYAEVASEPDLSLGGPDETGPTQFFRVQNVHVDPRGRLWIADGQSGELRIFLEDGSPWKVRGGRGQGPGEFRSIRLLGGGPGDSVFVADGSNGRISVYDPRGELVRTATLPSGDAPAPRLFDVFPDGSVLGQVPRVLSAAESEPGGVLRDSVELVRVDPDRRAWAGYGSALGPLWIWTGRAQIPVPFTTTAGFAVVGPDEVHVVSGPTFRIRVYHGERFEASYGVERPPRPVHGEDVAAYRRSISDNLSEEMAAAYLGALDHPAVPVELPAYARLLVSPDGEVWAQRYESDLLAPPLWDVFDREGRLIGRVRTPARFVVMCVAKDAIAGVWRDDVGVEYVRTYALLKSPRR